MRRGPLPPRRICPGCGGHYFTFTEGTACRACLAAGRAPITTFGNVAAGETVTASARRRAAEANRDLDHDDIPF